MLKCAVKSESMHCSHQFQALSVGSSLPSSQGPASQKVGHLVTFQSGSGRGTNSLQIILLLLLPPGSRSPSPALCISLLPCFKDQKPSRSSVRSPEVDHFNSASQIFFKRTWDPETSEPVTARWTRTDQPGPGARVNTANVSQSLIPPERFCSLPTTAQAFDVEQCVLL